MSSPTFGMPGTGNNAPPPVPGNTNPTGTNKGVGFGGVSFPSYPVFGAPQTGSPVTPSANAPIFGTPSTGGTPNSSGGLQNLNSGFDLGNNWQNFANMLGKAYGKGPGQAIYNILSKGLFNPQEAAAFLNAMQPSINQGLASVQNSFGAEGSRFGSAAALGIGNYESQVNLNEQQTLASMFMQAQQEQLQLLEGVLPTLQHERANQGSWIDKFIGFNELTTGLLTGNSGAVSGGNNLLGLGSGSSIPPASIPSFSPPGVAGNTGTFGSNAPTFGINSNSTLLDASAGSDLGGASFDPAMFAGLL